MKGRLLSNSNTFYTDLLLLTTCAANKAAVRTTASAAAAPAPPTLGKALAKLGDEIVWPSPREPNFWDRPARRTPAVVQGQAQAPVKPAACPDPLSIVHISAEMAPVAKVTARWLQGSFLAAVHASKGRLEIL